MSTLITLLDECLDVLLYDIQRDLQISETDTPKDLNHEEYRLKTFTNWNVSFVDKHELAMLGFYYTESSDAVQCVFCGVIIGDWKFNDKVYTRHTTDSPQCPLLNLRAEKNVALHAETLDYVLLTNLYGNPEDIQEAAEQHSSEIKTGPSSNKAVQSIENGTGAKPNSCSKSHIRSEKTCKICYDKIYNAAFLPCGHVLSCWECASACTKCPMCRKNITSVTKLYFC